MSEKVWELIKDGQIVQGVVALASVGTIVYLAIAGQPVPEALLMLSGSVVGFYFRATTEAAAERRIERQMRGE